MRIQLKKLRILNDNLLIEGVKPELRGGIARGVSTDDKPELGIVLAVGPGKMLDSGIVAPMEISVGDTVLFNQHTTIKFNFDGKDYFTIKAEDVIGYQK